MSITPESIKPVGEVSTNPASIDMNAVPSLTQDLAFRLTNSNLRMAFDRKSGVMFEFNDTASSFLGLIDSKRSFREIAAALAEEYDAAPADIEEDLRDLVARMLDSGVISVARNAS
jgi:hypothetical protein